MIFFFKQKTAYEMQRMQIHGAAQMNRAISRRQPGQSQCRNAQLLLWESGGRLSVDRPLTSILSPSERRTRIARWGFEIAFDAAASWHYLARGKLRKDEGIEHPPGCWKPNRVARHGSFAD